jgi:[ribosomal protein S5]-alanine N-acetyltransferase
MMVNKEPQIFAVTDRLILREIVAEDVEDFFEMDKDPAVHRYLGNKPVESREQMVEVIEFIRSQYAENGIGRWAVVEKDNKQFIGWAGLKLVKETLNHHQDYYDLGYRLNRNYWGKGYATEAARASLHYGLETMKLKEIFAAAHVDNVASNRILSGLGFVLQNTFYFDEELNNWYSIQG